MDIESLLQKEILEGHTYLDSMVFYKIEDLLGRDSLKWCQFLGECGISVKDNFYKDGKILDFVEVRKLYDDWLLLNS